MKMGRRLRCSSVTYRSRYGFWRRNGGGGPGRIQNGTEARRLLSRLLLGIDGSFIRLWSDWRESISC